jgi:hypothetical protein
MAKKAAKKGAAKTGGAAKKGAKKTGGGTKKKVNKPRFVKRVGNLK